MPNLPESFASHRWDKPDTIVPVRYTCGYCGSLTTSEKGWRLVHEGDGKQTGGVFICPGCLCPTFHYPKGEASVPGAPFGKPVSNLPEDLAALYEEARTCTANNCYTAAVLALRKMLMNIAVSQGAEEGIQFIAYVNYLADNHFIPPNGTAWVDHIRRRGNEATHEIQQMTRDDARDLVVFIEMLLRFIYEFPGMIQPSE